MRRERGSLGHEASKVGVEDSNILYRCYKSDVPVWSDNDDRTSITIDSVCRVSLSASVERDADVVNENPK